MSKIALLNLPVDNNYGGMLQRYALVKVLEDMGHEVVHLNLRFPINDGTLVQKLRRSVRRVVGRIRGNYKGAIRAEHWAKKQYDESCRVTDEFYDKYIRHTSYITNKAELAKKCKNMDALIIGSDQVWRKEYEGKYGIGTYFGDFLPPESAIKKIVYGASFGVSEDRLSARDKEYLSPLYQRFTSVSVREDSGLQLLNEYGWVHPQAEQVLDPTLLLTKEDYFRLIDSAFTSPLDGNMLCYILDKTEEKEKVVSRLALEKSMKPFHLSIDGKISVEQWLRSFRDAEYIVTDSYHGVVFAIIMRKPFYLFINRQRGSARFDSLLRLCGISGTCDIYDGCACLKELIYYKNQSLNFLKKSVGII